jgi:glucan phosphoethanolaminetransferase (alkaline phosphatase superfamily)
MRKEMLRATTLLAFTVAKVVGLFLLVVLQSDGFVGRIRDISFSGDFPKMFVFLALWSLCVSSLPIVAFHPSPGVRVSWGILLSAGSTIAFAYRRLAGSELSAHEMVSLWGSRHEAWRMLDHYDWLVPEAAFVFAACLAMFAAPHGVTWIRGVRRWPAAILPVVPIVAIAVLMAMYEGRGSTALPRAIAQVSVVLFGATRLALEEVPERRRVDIAAGPSAARHVALLVDESIRGDHVDLERGGSATPWMADNASRFVDFGRAVSGGNCSHYSNVMLRFGARPDDLVGSVRTNPSIWEYARAAGYRTVYIDAQSSSTRLRGTGGATNRLQNFMTTAETAYIDAFHQFDAEVPPEMLDMRLAEIVAKEFASSEKVFVYANKNGAHFPYRDNYPAVLAPKETGDDASVLASQYAAAVRWTVDEFFRKFVSDVPLDDAVVVYTSDHGQRLVPGSTTHCNMVDPDPVEGVVPLLVLAEGGTRDSFAAAAVAGYGRSGHFGIVPSILEVMGYARGDVVARHGRSLFEPDGRTQSFATGDIMAFAEGPFEWHSVDEEIR